MRGDPGGCFSSGESISMSVEAQLLVCLTSSAFVGLVFQQHGSDRGKQICNRRKQKRG